MELNHDPTEDEIMQDFMNYLNQHPEVSLEDLGIIYEEIPSPYGMIKSFNVDSILKSNYHEFSSLDSAKEIVN